LSVTSYEENSNIHSKNIKKAKKKEKKCVCTIQKKYTL